MVIKNGKQIKKAIKYDLGFETFRSFADKYGTDGDRLSRSLSGSYHAYNDSIEALKKAGLRVEFKQTTRKEKQIA